MNKSNTIKELALAFSKAQAEMPPAELNAFNPFLKNKYADLGSIIKTEIPVLSKHGLSVSQLPTSNDEGVGITTILMHSSGEWIESTIVLPVGEAKGLSSAQVAGSVISYLRRYSLASILGMYADEDTAGNETKPKAKKGRKPQSKQETNSKMSLKIAESIKNSKGIPYGDLESETLSHMSGELAKSLKSKDLSNEDRELREMKLDAIPVILAARNEEE